MVMNRTEVLHCDKCFVSAINKALALFLMWVVLLSKLLAGCPLFYVYLLCDSIV